MVRKLDICVQKAEIVGVDSANRRATNCILGFQHAKIVVLAIFTLLLKKSLSSNEKIAMYCCRWGNSLGKFLYELETKR